MSASNNKTAISRNSVSLAGEFAVLSRLALCGYDANMTLGRTKSVDILVSDPRTNQLYQLEVKTAQNRRNRPPVSKMHGRFLCDWMMGAKHESVSTPTLWYCFVAIVGLDLKTARYFVVPSDVVAEYVRAEHQLWLDAAPRPDTPMRTFRIGFKEESYAIATPSVEQYEDNWEFKR